MWNSSSRELRESGSTLQRQWSSRAGALEPGREEPAQHDQAALDRSSGSNSREWERPAEESADARPAVAAEAGGEAADGAQMEGAEEAQMAAAWSMPPLQAEACDGGLLSARLSGEAVAEPYQTAPFFPPEADAPAVYAAAAPADSSGAAAAGPPAFNGSPRPGSQDSMQRRMYQPWSEAAAHEVPPAIVAAPQGELTALEQGAASADMELALEDVLEVPEPSSAPDVALSAGLAAVTALHAQLVPPQAGAAEQQAAGAVPAAAPNRRRSSHAGAGAQRGMRRRKSLTKRPELHRAAAGDAAGAAGFVPPEPTAAAAGNPERTGTGGEEGRQEDILAELEVQRARHAEQLKLEARVRAELEGMITRIERHFKKEQTGRKQAEEQLAQAAAERDGLLAQLEAERAQQAAMLQQAVQERGMVEERCAAQLAAAHSELEATRQEMAARIEAMAAELAGWRGSADATARELQEQAQEFAGAGARMRQLADRLAGGGGGGGTGMMFDVVGPGAASSGSEMRAQAGQPALHFHHSAAGAGGSPGAGVSPARIAPAASSPSKRSPARGGGGERVLPMLKKTQAVPGTQLRQPAISNGGALPALGSGSPGSRGLQRERSNGGMPAWNAAADRTRESQRDAGMVAHMASRWNRG